MKCLDEPIESPGSGQWDSTTVPASFVRGVLRPLICSVDVRSGSGFSAGFPCATDLLGLSSLSIIVPLPPSPWYSHSCPIQMHSTAVCHWRGERNPPAKGEESINTGALVSPRHFHPVSYPSLLHFFLHLHSPMKQILFRTVLSLC